MTGYHRGALAVQERAGLAAQADSSLGAIRETIPEVAAAFLADQAMIVVGGADARGRLWATQLIGEPGFLTTPTAHTLGIGAVPRPEDPLAALLDTATPVRIGMIAIEPATRRRMRINGRASRHDHGIQVQIDQVFANCPKYIQKRSIAPPNLRQSRRVVTDGTELSPAQQRTLGTADTFFIATASDQGDTDVSHRGGNPGFVQVLSPTLLRWPDYVGNAMFLTLGNLEVNASAGILVPGWDTGTALHLSGTARTLWDVDEINRMPGAQRIVEFQVSCVREITSASALRWSEPQYSRFNPPVGRT